MGEIEKFIDEVKWVFAKTYAKTTPHEYIVYEKLSEDHKKLFKDFASLIMNDGYVKKFYDTPFTYYDIGKKKYWVMDNIINRDDIKNDYSAADN